MFTGIVEAVGTVAGIEGPSDLRSVRIECREDFARDLRPGASIAVDGACLTAVDGDGSHFRVEVVGTTLSRTVAGSYEIGSKVNLERATRLGGRLDGHLVQGHVDGIGHITDIREAGGFHVLQVSIPEEVHALTIAQGSIALNGISLTVSRLLGRDGIEVAIVPHTWEYTNLSYIDVGDPVNVEGDLIGKYVGKLLLHKGKDEDLEQG